MVAPAPLRVDFKSAHTTYRTADGDVVPGVTTVLGMLNKPGLLKWAWRLGRDGIEMERSRDGAADTGTVAHALCEAYLRGVPLDTANIPPEMLTAANAGATQFFGYWRREGLRPVAIERQLVSERLRVGGTLDVLAQRGTGDLVLLDLKTGKAIYPEMLIQAAVYAAMWEEIEGAPVRDVVIVRIGQGEHAELEVRTVEQREARVAAFAALAEARRKLLATGWR